MSVKSPKSPARNGAGPATPMSATSATKGNARPPKDGSHIPALDGLRGVAILLVMVNHILICRPQSFTGLRSFLENVGASAGYGVQLFFVLSGFLITGILLDSKGSRHYFLSFYGRRTLRIFPVYYGTLLVFTVLIRTLGSDYPLLLRRLPWLLTYTDNVLIAVRGEWVFKFDGFSLGHFWSLAVEEQFYLVWPWVVLFCAPRQLKWICCLAIPFGLAWRTGFFVGYNNLPGAIVFLPCQVDALAVGALLAALVRQREQAVASRTWVLFASGAALWLASCCDARLLITTGLTGFALMSAGLLALALSGRMSRLFCIPILRSVGKYSYAIYVYHVIFLPVVVWLIPPDTLGRELCAGVLYVTGSYLAGWLSWHCFEVYFHRLKRFFPVEKSHPWRPQHLAAKA